MAAVIQQQYDDSLEGQFVTGAHAAWDQFVGQREAGLQAALNIANSGTSFGISTINGLLLLGHFVLTGDAFGGNSWQIPDPNWSQNLVITESGNEYAASRDAASVAVAAFSFVVPIGEVHHLLPQAARFTAFFADAGLDIENFTVRLPASIHRLLPFGIHTRYGVWAEDWLTAWDNFKFLNPQATGTEILAQLDKMITNFHLEYWLHH